MEILWHKTLCVSQLCQICTIWLDEIDVRYIDVRIFGHLDTN